MRKALGIGAIGLLGGAGCPRQEPRSPLTPPPVVVAGAKVTLPDGGIHHTERLAWVGWRADGSFGACGRRTDELSHRGKLSRCVLVSAPGAAATETDWSADPSYVIDRSPPDTAPGVCRVLSDDIPGDPGSPAARATLHAPSGARLLDEWRPPNAVDGDYFSVETSFSAAGDRVAILHVAVGLGEGERSIDVVSVEVVPTPPCK